MLYYNDQTIRYTYRYDTDCKIGVLCRKNITIPIDINSPIFIYYELKNFYQNYDNYMYSKENNQLSGKIMSLDDLDKCRPIIKNKDIKTDLRNLDGDLLDPDEPANPCGLIAKTYFTDRYKLYNKIDNTNIKINEKNIALSYDLNFYKNPPNYQKLQWLNVTDEHFMVWMRISPLNRFKKLWGRIEIDLKAGEYILEIENNYEVEYFKGVKSFVIANESFLGQKNDVLVWGYIAFGIFNLIVFLAHFIFYVQKFNKKN